MKKYILLALAVVILFCGGYVLKDKFLKDKQVASYLQKTYELPVFEEDFPSPTNVKLFQVDLREKDLSELDIHDRSKDLFHAYFDTTTKWPSKDKMPKDYNPKEVSSYSAGKFWEGGILSRKTPEQFLEGDKNYLYLPMDSRAVAGPNYNDEYVFYRYGAFSWVVPYISGLYVLACDVNPEVTPELFWKTAMETGKETKVDYKSKTFEIKHMVSPVDLINKLKSLK